MKKNSLYLSSVSVELIWPFKILLASNRLNQFFFTLRGSCGSWD